MLMIADTRDYKKYYEDFNAQTTSTLKIEEEKKIYQAALDCVDYSNLYNLNIPANSKKENNQHPTPNNTTVQNTSMNTCITTGLKVKSIGAAQMDIRKKRTGTKNPNYLLCEEFNESSKPGPHGIKLDKKLTNKKLAFLIDIMTTINEKLRYQFLNGKKGNIETILTKHNDELNSQIMNDGHVLMRLAANLLVQAMWQDV